MSAPPRHANDARRRGLLLALGSLVLLLGRSIAGAPGIVAVRVWPAADYTRVTLESTGAGGATSDADGRTAWWSTSTAWS
jgi:N-acetylmuramoyl-L-alanine amidase